MGEMPNVSQAKTPSETSTEASTRSALSRVGVVDVGSNSVRLVVFDGANRSPAYFYNEKIMCQLGADMASTGRLNPEGRVRALSAIKRFQMLARQMGTGPLNAVATAAVRDSVDGPEFQAQVHKETGLDLRVIDGTEEARLSAQGVMLGWPGSYGLVCDIGGSSMELAEIDGGTIGKCLTSPLGPLKLAAMSGTETEKLTFIRDTIANMHKTLGPQHDRLFLVGGSWRAIARIDMERRGYPLHVLHEYRISSDTVPKLIEYITQSDLEELRQACFISSTRMALVPQAAQVLRELVDEFEPHDIAISSYGLREGLLYETMPQAMRDCDPLIEACQHSETRDARLPGFGARLYDFLTPIFPDASPARLRIIHAACLLHDVSWRAHPDYRAEVCFDYATRANLGGLTHSERVFLGMALMHRYSSKRFSDRYDHMFTLLSYADQQEAQILGRAMRLGAMLWLDADTAPGQLSWDAENKVLIIKLNRLAEPLFGEVANSRFAELAQVMGAEDSRIEFF